MFVTFEGVEGAGKSTALKNMARELGQEGADVLVTREPGGSGLGKALRTLLLDCNSQITPDAELCLFLADRAQHVAEVIRPALAAGKVVLCDRYADSTFAYQGFARGMGSRPAPPSQRRRDRRPQARPDTGLRRA